MERTRNGSGGRCLLAVTLLIGLAGCKPDHALKNPEVLGNGVAPRQAPVTSPDGVTGVDPASLGVIAGVVNFHGQTPERLKLDTTMDPGCSNPNALSEQYVVNDGKLANVYLYVKSGPAEAMNAAGDDKALGVVIDQKGCVYAPHVVAVMHGGYVEFRNEDATPHNIHTMPTVVGNQTVDLMQGAKGVPISRQMMQVEEMMPVRCNMHPWMEALINVAPTAFFAVTDEAGRYTIKGLPPGDYVIGAVHEKLGEQSLHLSVKPGATTHADFAFAIQ